MKTMRRGSGVRPFVLATILALGAVAAWAAAVGWSGGVLKGLFMPERPMESLVLTHDGQPLIQLYNPDSFPTYSYRDLDGKPVSITEQEVLAFWSPIPPKLQLPKTTEWYWRIVSTRDGAAMPTFWYLVQDTAPAGAAYFVGYDGKSKHRIGYMGRKGFQLDLPSLEDRFLLEGRMSGSGAVVSPYWTAGQEPRDIYSPQSDFLSLFLVSEGKLFRVHFGQRSVRQIETPEPVVAIGMTLKPSRPGEYDGIERYRLVVRMANQLMLVDFLGETKAKLPLPSAAQPLAFSFATTARDDYVLSSMPSNYWHERTYHLFWLDAEGKLTRTEHVELPPQANDRAASAWMMATIFPSPLILGVIDTMIGPWSEVDIGREPDYRTALAATWRFGWPSRLLVAILAVALAIVCDRHQRQMGSRNAISWTLFVLVGGVPGFVGYWLHRRWPVVERCPQCGAAVPRDRAACLACSVQFAPPALKGTEIFA